MKRCWSILLAVLLTCTVKAQVTKVIVGGFDKDSLHNRDVRISFLQGYSSYNGEQFPGIVDVGMGDLMEDYSYADTNGYQMLIVSYAYNPSYWAAQASFHPGIMGCFPAGSNSHILRYNGDITALPGNMVITGAGAERNLTAYKINFHDVDPLSSNNYSSFSNGYIAGKIAYVRNHCGIPDPSWDEIKNAVTSTASRNGALDLEDGYGIINVGNAVTAVLPVELTSFSYELSRNGVLLQWKTATEVNNYGFEIERSLSSENTYSNGTDDWEKIGFVSGNGNSNSGKQYSFFDNSPAGGSEFCYRLKQIDFNGKFKYSEILTVRYYPSGFELYQNYPNPFNPVTTVKFSIPIRGFVTIDVFNLLGEKVAVILNRECEVGIHEIEFSAAGISSGVYFYEINAYSEDLSIQKFHETKRMLYLK